MGWPMTLPSRPKVITYYYFELWAMGWPMTPLPKAKSYKILLFLLFGCRVTSDPFGNRKRKGTELLQNASRTVGKGRRPGVIRRRAGGPSSKRGPPLPPTYIGLMYYRPSTALPASPTFPERKTNAARRPVPQRKHRQWETGGPQARSKKHNASPGLSFSD